MTGATILDGRWTRFVRMQAEFHGLTPTEFLAWLGDKGWSIMPCKCSDLHCPDWKVDRHGDPLLTAADFGEVNGER